MFSCTNDGVERVEAGGARKEGRRVDEDLRRALEAGDHHPVDREQIDRHARESQDEKRSRRAPLHSAEVIRRSRACSRASDGAHVDQRDERTRTRRRTCRSPRRCRTRIAGTRTGRTAAAARCSNRAARPGSARRSCRRRASNRSSPGRRPRAAPAASAGRVM